VPIYTYECQSCSSSLERRQSFNDEPLKTHDDCGGSLRRVIYPAGIVFKGSGFYNTDYKNGTSSNKAAENGDAKAYGAGLLSSFGELGRFASQAELKPFDLAEIARTPYDPTNYQKVLFVAPSFKEMEKRVGGWLEEVIGRARDRKP